MPEEVKKSKKSTKSDDTDKAVTETEELSAPSEEIVEDPVKVEEPTEELKAEEPKPKADEEELTPEQIEDAWKEADLKEESIDPDPLVTIDIPVSNDVVPAPAPVTTPPPDLVVPTDLSSIPGYEEKLANFLANNPYSSASDVRPSDLA